MPKAVWIYNEETDQIYQKVINIGDEEVIVLNRSAPGVASDKIRQKHQSSIKTAALAFCQKNNINTNAFFSKRRGQWLAFKRFEFWSMMHMEGFSKSQIARVFDKDHTSVVHGINKYAELTEKYEDPEQLMNKKGETNGF